MELRNLYSKHLKYWEKAKHFLKINYNGNEREKPFEITKEEGDNREWTRKENEKSWSRNRNKKRVS